MVMLSIIEMLIFLIITSIIVLTLNYILLKDFRILINKIKRVISSPRQANKITQIQKLLYNYFF